MNAIYPCPFCGELIGEDPIQEEEIENGHVAYFIACSTCGSIGPSGNSQEDAVKQWNRRHVMGTDLDAYTEANEKLGATDWALHLLTTAKETLGELVAEMQPLDDLFEEVKEAFNAAEEAEQKRVDVYKKWHDAKNPGGAT